MKKSLSIILNFLLIFSFVAFSHATEEYVYVTKWNTDGYPRGIAVDKDGYIYAAGEQRVVKYSHDGSVILTIQNIPNNDDFTFSSWDMHVAVDSSGYIYVSNQQDHNVVKFDSNGNYVTKWGSQGSGDTDFNGPMGIVVDSNGNVYVCDGDNHRIVKFDSDGTYLTSWGTDGWDSGQFRRPREIVVDSENGEIYVTEEWNQRIQVFDLNGTFKRQWSTDSSAGDGSVEQAYGIALDSQSNVYVTESKWMNNKIVKFSSDGTFICKWGGYGTDNYHFHGLQGITVDYSDNVYVVDHQNDNWEDRRIIKYKIKGSPTIEITNPTQNEFLTGTVTIQASVTVLSGYTLSKVEFYLDDTKLGETTSSPYTYDWDTTASSNGSYTLWIAATNTEGTTSREKVSIIVANGDAAPTISITSPSDLEKIRWTVDIEVDASDDIGINKVEFYLDDTKLGEVTADPYTYSWDTTTVSDDVYGVKAKIYDTIGQTSEDSITVTVNNYEEYGFVSTWNTDSPRSLVLDSDGNLYVAGNYSIKKFDSDGTLLLTIGEGIEYTFAWDMYVAVDQSSGSIYVTVPNEHKVIKFDSSGNYVDQWGSYGTGNSQFWNPQGIAVDSEGYVYVCDGDNHRIVKYNSDGDYQTKWGSQGSGNSQFEYPSDAAVDSSNNLYVVDRNNNRVQVFSSTGTYVTKWGTHGSANDNFDYPQGIAVDSEGNVYVADTNNRRIVKYSSQGTYITDWGSQGSGDYNFDWPYDVAVDSSGYVYVADGGINNRIMKFKSTWLPTIKITNPANNASVSDTVAIQASVECAIGINKVEFYIDGDLESTDTSSPYTYDWDTTLESDGVHAIKATVYTEQSKTKDAEISVVVNNSGDSAPTVSITNPADGATVSVAATITAEASDDIGIEKVEFYIDDELLGTDTESPYEYSWDATTTEDGDRQIKVIAYDTIGQNVEASIYVTVSNLEEFEYVSKWSTTDEPRSIALDSNGNLYVAGSYRIKKYGSDGTLLFEIDDSESTEYMLDWEMRVAVDPSNGSIYVTLWNNSKVIKFDSEGNYVKQWGSEGIGNIQNWHPQGIAVDSEGYVYVCDGDNHNIIKYNSNGNYQTKWGSQGSGDSQFENPSDIAVDSSDNLYVVDRNHNRVQVFDSTGAFVRKWGRHGSDNDSFDNPQGIAVDSEGNVYVADTNNRRIVKYSSQGIFITKWGSQGSGDLNFDWPYDVAVDSSGYVYVADGGINNRIMKFRSIWLPTVEITNPIDNEIVSDTVMIQATAESGIEISKVEFYIDEALKSTDTSSPYEYEWDTTLEYDWTYEIKAVAYNIQGKTGEAEISVTVNNGGVSPPRLSITNPVDGATVRLSTTIKADASSSGEIDKVEFYVDDNLLETDTVSPYQYTWDATTVENGQKTIKVIAYDTIGLTTEVSVTVTVSNYEEFEYVSKWSISNPRGLALDSDGNLYVAGDNRIQKFDPDGILLFTIEDDPGMGYMLNWEMRVAVDGSNNIYVTNRWNNTVMKFNSAGEFIDQWGNEGIGDNNLNNPEGIAVDDSGGYVYVCDSENHRIVKYNSDGAYVTKFGSSSGSGDGEFWNPKDIAVDSSGNIYVADSGNHRIQVLDSNGTFLRKWSDWESGSLQLNWPEGIALDSDGNVYVADTNNWRIMKYSSHGTFITHWGAWGTGDYNFDRPIDVAVDSSGYVYVADCGMNNRIVKFRSSWLPTIEITYPTDHEAVSDTITIQASVESALEVSKVEFYINGVLESTDTSSPYTYDWDTTSELDGPHTIKAAVYNIQNTTAEDEISAVVNNSGNEPPTISITNPEDGATVSVAEIIKADASDSEGIDSVEFYVNDELLETDTESPYEYTWDATTTEDGSATIKVIVYDTLGQRDEDSVTVTVNNHEEFEYVSKWSTEEPRSIALDSDGNLYVAGSNKIKKFDTNGTLLFTIEGGMEYQFDWQMCVAVDQSNGDIYVTSPFNHMVIKFDSNGTFVTQWGGFGNGQGQFDQPQGIAVDSEGYVYVCDEMNGRVQKFDPEGNYLSQWGWQGSGDGEFWNPKDVAVDSSGNIYVADSGNNRIQVLDSEGNFLRKWPDWESGDLQLNWPEGIALDNDGNVYVADTNNQRIVKYSSQGTYITHWGSKGSGDENFDWPRDVAVDSSGYVYVADAGWNSRIVKFKSGWLPKIEITSPADNASVSGDAVTIQASVECAIGVSKVEFYIDDVLKSTDTSSPYTYVWDTTSELDGPHTIEATVYTVQNKTEHDEISVVVNNTGYEAPTVSITNPEDGATVTVGVNIRADASSAEAGIAEVEFYADDKLLGNDTESPYEYTWDATTTEEGEVTIKVIAYDIIGQRAEDSVTVTVNNAEEFGFVSKWSFDNPTSLAIDKDGSLYVAGSNKIKKFDPDGIELLTIDDRNGMAEYRFDWEMYIAVDQSDGSLYVVNRNDSKIIKFNSEGKYLSQWGSQGDQDGQFYFPQGIGVDSEGYVYVCDTDNHRIQKFDPDGTFVASWGSFQEWHGGPEGPNEDEFQGPMGIVLDDSNNMYITEGWGHRVKVLSSDGTFLTKWGEWGFQDTNFNEPRGIALDSGRYLYIADSNNNRIVKYSTDGMFLAKWGSQGSTDDNFEWPSDVAVDSSGYVYVADRNNNRIVKFRSTWLPSIEITSPVNNEVLAGTVTIQADVDCAAGIDKVEIYINETKLGEATFSLITSTYEYSWDTTLYSDGMYTIKATLYTIQDKTDDAEIFVVVNNSNDTAPEVSITNPEEGATLRRKVKIQAEASDDIGIWKVEFYAAETLLTSVTESPYEYEWDTETVDDGEKIVKVIAYDTIGQNDEASVNVTVRNTDSYEFAAEYKTDWNQEYGYGNPDSITIDQYGRVYVTFHERIAMFTSKGNFLGVIDNEDNNDEFKLTHDMHVAVDKYGDIYVSCPGTHSILKFDSMGNYLTSWGSQGSGEGEFSRPQGIAVDSEANVYVCDGWNHDAQEGNRKIVKFDSEGTYLGEWGGEDDGPLGPGDNQFGHLENPMDIVIDGTDTIYVVDAWMHRVVVFDNEGTFLRTWGDWGYGDYNLQNPEGIGIDDEGNIYVADTGNHRIVKYTAEGIFRAKWGSQGYGEYNFEWPRDVAVSPSGYVFVADNNNQRIVVYKMKGMPTVSITNPTADSTVSGEVAIQIAAESEYGISKVELYIDGTLKDESVQATYSNGVKIAAATSSNYEYTWDTTLEGNGSHDIEAVAYNSDGKSAISEITVIVNNGGDAAPTLSITNPKEGAIIRGVVSIKAEATDDIGIEKVEFYVDEELLDTVTESPYEYSWDSTIGDDGQKELKVVAMDTISQKTWTSVSVTVDNENRIFSINLTGAAVIYLTKDHKLKKLDTNGYEGYVINENVKVQQFQFDPQGNLYIVFEQHQQLQDGESYILVKVDPATNEATGIDSSLNNLVWNKDCISNNLQFDQEGNVYYFAESQTDEGDWERVLRKYVDADNIEDIINRNMEIYQWQVRNDGTIVVAGKTLSSDETWLRKVNPEAEEVVVNLAEPDWPHEWGWMARFPDDLIYITLTGSWLDLDGIYRLEDDLHRLQQEDALAPYIGDMEGSEYRIDDLMAGHSEEYLKGITLNGRVRNMISIQTDDAGNVYGLCGSRESEYKKYRTVMRLYPVPEVIEPQLIDRAQMMTVSFNQLVIAGYDNESGKYKLILYDISSRTELNLMYQNIEIYHLGTLSNGSILFDGLNLSTNKVIIGMFERAVSASSGGAFIQADDYGLTVLSEIGSESDKPLGFGVIRDQSSSSDILVAAIASPSHGATVSGTVQIKATASAENGVSKVEFFIDDELIETDETTPYSCSWDTTTVSDGSHTIKAKVTDTADQTAESEITVTVSNSSPGEIKLSESQLYFGASAGGNSTGSQTIMITQTGGKALNWSATSSESWLQISPTSGTGAGKITVSVDTTGLSEGTHSGTIEIEDPDATNSPQTITVTLEIYGPISVQAPFGSVDTPTDGTTGVAGAIPVSGWALDDIEVTKVEIWRDPVGNEETAACGLVYVGDATLVEGARPDIEQEYADYPFSYRAGWGYMLLTNYLPNQGNSSYTIHVIANDREGNSVELGTTTITCDNTSATKPFGTIDTPTQGGEASGDDYLNFGWALTPQPNSIPEDGSTITVYIDGEEAGNPVYGQYREDVAELFAGYANTNGAVGYFYIDTTAYESGVHTITWSVEDSAGNTDDVGTRYFTIFNTEATGLLQTGMMTQRVNLDTQYSFEFVNGLPSSFEPVKVRKAHRLNAEPEIALVDYYGFINIEIREVERVAVQFGKIADCKGYLVVGEELRPIPIGSSLNTKKGTFSWQPGPGFLGEYNLVFLVQDDTGLKKTIRIKIKILPKFSIY